MSSIACGALLFKDSGAAIAKEEQKCKTSKRRSRFILPVLIAESSVNVPLPAYHAFYTFEWDWELTSRLYDISRSSYPTSSK